MSGEVVRTVRALREKGRAVEVSFEELRTVPAAAVRAATALAGGALLLAAGFHRLTGPSGGVFQIVAVALLLAGVAWARSGYLALLLPLVGLRLLGVPTLDALPLAAVLLAAHVTFALGTVAARLPWGCRVETSVLAGLLRRGMPVQVGVQALALVVRPVLTDAEVRGGGLWRLAALALALVLVVAVLPGRDR